YPRAVGCLFTIALLLPTLALAGFVAGGREVSVLAGTPGWTDALMRATHPPGAAETAALGRVRNAFLDAYLVALGAVLAARGVRPVRDVAVLPLLAPSIAAADAFGPDVRQGREQEVAVLFADLRGFTRVAEHKLPYDVVFILNRYFEAVGGAIHEAGGIPNQFTGDGVMALFGVETGVELGCRQAVAAARAIVRHLAALNRELGEALQVPLRIGIGIHAGPAIVGRMGYGEGVYLTAVGDTVHVASRLEQL